MPPFAPVTTQSQQLNLTTQMTLAYVLLVLPASLWAAWYVARLFFGQPGMLPGFSLGSLA